MKIIKCCLKYLLTFLMPLIALRLSVRFIGSGLHMSPMEIIRVYVVIVLLLFSVLHLRFKKFEPIVLLLPLIYIFPFCLNPQSYLDIISSEQPLVHFFRITCSWNFGADSASVACSLLPTSRNSSLRSL